MDIKKKNKYLIILSIILILIGSIIPNYCNAINLQEDISFTGYGTVPLHLQAYSLNGGYISTHLVGYYDNGTFYPAYCMNLRRPGADNDTVHTVNLMELLKDNETYNQVWRVVTSGYPYRTPEQLGVSDWRSAYQGTKYAIYCTLGQAEVDNFYGSDAEGQAIANLIRNLYEIGQNGTATYKTPVANISKSGNISLSGDYYIQNYTISSNVDIDSYSVAITGFPSGTKTTNISGTEKTSFYAGETMQLRLPKNAVETGDINGRIRVDVNARSYAVFYRKNI